MHFMKWARVMLPVVFKKFEPVCIFFATFFFALLLSIGKRLTLANFFSRGGLLPPAPPVYGPALTVQDFVLKMFHL